jgi:hypothetical protein
MPVEEHQWRSRKVRNDSWKFHERVPVDEGNLRLAREPTGCICIQIFVEFD